MFPSHLDGGFHVVGQDNKLRWSAGIIAAKAHDVDLGHGGRKNSLENGGEQEGRALLTTMASTLKALLTGAPITKSDCFLDHYY